MTVTQHPSGMVLDSSNTVALRNFDGTSSEASLLTHGNFNNNSVLYSRGFYFKA